MNATTWYWTLSGAGDAAPLPIPKAERLLREAGSSAVPSWRLRTDSCVVVVGAVLIVQQRRPRWIERLNVHRVMVGDEVPAEVPGLCTADWVRVGQALLRRTGGRAQDLKDYVAFLSSVHGFLPIEVATEMGLGVTEVHRSYARIVRTGAYRHPIWDLRAGCRVQAGTRVAATTSSAAAAAAVT